MSSFEDILARHMTPAMQKAADELELRIGHEDEPESRALADLYDKVRKVQVLFISLGVTPTAADLLAGAKELFAREEFEFLRPDLDGAPMGENVVAFRSPSELPAA